MKDPNRLLKLNLKFIYINFPETFLLFPLTPGGRGAPVANDFHKFQRITKLNKNMK